MYHISFTDGQSTHTLHCESREVHTILHLLEDSRYTRVVMYSDFGINLGMTRNKSYHGFDGYAKLQEYLYLDSERIVDEPR